MSVTNPHDARSDIGTDISFSNNWFDRSAKGIWDALIPRINPRKILEIGSYEGASACYLIKNCASVAPIEIHCIDTWDGGIEHKEDGVNMPEVERRFHDNVSIARARAPHNVDLRVHKGYSSACLTAILAEGYLDYFDLIYIDGSHQAPDVLTDAVMSFLLLKTDGVMIFDDYIWRDGSGDLIRQPKSAIDAFLNIYFHKMQILLSPNTQVCARKISK